ncbi:MAG: ATP-binding protein [Pseudomonadota bacterium]
MTTFRSLFPDGLAGRFALLLTASLIVANLLALAVLSFERNRLDRVALVSRLEDRVASLLPALESVPPDARARLAAIVSTRSSEVTIDETPLIAAQPSTPRSQDLAGTLAEVLGDREVAASLRVQREDGKGPERKAVLTSVRLELPDGQAPQWLNIVSRGPRPQPPWIEEGAFLLILGASLTAVLGVGLLFVRRLTRPLTQLATAAQAAGDGDRDARVNADGPKEVRDAATAFNDMQARIARFDAERMRVLAAVGHDLRTPLTSLRIRAEMLESEDSTAMIRTLDQMTVMADGLVSYARGTGDGEDVVDVDLGMVLNQVCSERDLPITPCETVTVRGRPVALGRAFGNLIDNALHYGTSVEIAVKSENKQAVVTINDDGPGIADDKIDRVFDPFVRGDESRSADHGGVGLGLTIASDVIAAHGGHLSLENGREGGLRATIVIPLANIDDGHID